MSRLAVMTACAALCSGCLTQQAYEGPRRNDSEVAHISGDPRITAGTPVSVILRQVDGQTLGVGQSSVEVLPGEHALLADCRIAETGSVSRHSLQAEVVPGRRYKLMAQTGPGLRECTAVYLEAID